ncbi:hypothetical protein DRH14_02125 [Candidatus Shapirobacteria bacterium]|nr:MAG: hypothetical protein DRH14_02125 [Candidatus Shapirobacteria bacterium]
MKKKILILTMLSLFFGLLYQDNLFRIKLKSFSLSRGTHYFNNLLLWHYYVDHQQWSSAISLEKDIDTLDIDFWKQNSYPPLIKKRLNNLLCQTNKSVDDLIEIARLYSKLGQLDKSHNYLLMAQQTDPIRDDITQLLLQTNPF